MIKALSESCTSALNFFFLNFFTFCLFRHCREGKISEIRIGRIARDDLVVTVGFRIKSAITPSEPWGTAMSARWGICDLWRRVCGSVSFPALLRDVGDTPHTAHKPFGLVLTGGIQPKFLGPLRFFTPHWALHRNDIGCVSAPYSCCSLSLGHGLYSLRVRRWSPRAARVRRKLRVVSAVVVGDCTHARPNAEVCLLSLRPLRPSQ